MANFVIFPCFAMLCLCLMESINYTKFFSFETNFWLLLWPLSYTFSKVFFRYYFKWTVAKEVKSGPRFEVNMSSNPRLNLYFRSISIESLYSSGQKLREFYSASEWTRAIEGVNTAWLEFPISRCFWMLRIVAATIKFFSSQKTFDSKSFDVS